jgi:hypothetical protein
MSKRTFTENLQQKDSLMNRLFFVAKNTNHFQIFR